MSAKTRTLKSISKLFWNVILCHKNWYFQLLENERGNKRERERQQVFAVRICLSHPPSAFLLRFLTKKRNPKRFGTWNVCSKVRSVHRTTSGWMVNNLAPLRDQEALMFSLNINNNKNQLKEKTLDNGPISNQTAEHLKRNKRKLKTVSQQ